MPGRSVVSSVMGGVVVVVVVVVVDGVVGLVVDGVVVLEDVDEVAGADVGLVVADGAVVGLVVGLVVGDVVTGSATVVVDDDAVGSPPLPQAVSPSASAAAVAAAVRPRDVLRMWFPPE